MSSEKNSKKRTVTEADLETLPQPPPSQRQPKYIFIGAFTHGSYGLASQPYKVNEHASISIRPFVSTPKLFTFINCAPGNVLIGEDDGNDNAKLTKYFKTNSKINIIDTDNQNAKKQSQDNKIAENFSVFFVFFMVFFMKNIRISHSKMVEDFCGLEEREFLFCLDILS